MKDIIYSLGWLDDTFKIYKGNNRNRTCSENSGDHSGPSLPHGGYPKTYFEDNPPIPLKFMFFPIDCDTDDSLSWIFQHFAGAAFLEHSVSHHRKN